MLQCIHIQLIEQTLQLLQRGVILAAGINHILQIGQADLLKRHVVQCTANLVGRLLSMHIGS